MPNALAPKPKNSFTQFQYADPMMNQVPSVNWEKQIVASKPEGYTIGEWLDALQQGLGRGIGEAEVGNLQMATDLVTRPRGVYQDLVQAAKTVAQNPSVIMNALNGMKNQAASGPYGLGQVVGGFLNPRSLLQPKALMSQLDVHHGTPHTLPPEPGAPLGKFRSDKIGTGEGKQMFGHGLYFAESPKVGGEYKANLSYRKMVKKFRDAMPDDADTNDALDWARSGEASPEMANVIEHLADNDWLGFDYPSQALTALFKEPGAFEMSGELKKAADAVRGNLYKVDLPDEKIAQMLDWDKPLNQQPASVRAAINGIVESEELDTGKYSGRFRDGSYTGGEVVNILNEVFGSPKTTSAYLQQAGIPGTKYFDGNSRVAGQGTRNFVVFPGEEQHLTILERNGQKP